jgi:hypothetical protein
MNTYNSQIIEALNRPPQYFPKANEIKNTKELREYADPIFKRLCFNRYKKRLAKKVYKKQHLKADFINEYYGIRLRRVGEVLGEEILAEMGREGFCRKLFGNLS